MDGVDQMFEQVLCGRAICSVGGSLLMLGIATVLFTCIYCLFVESCCSHSEGAPKQRKAMSLCLAVSLSCWIPSAVLHCVGSMYPKDYDLETIGTYKAVKEACSSDMFKAFVESVMDSNVIKREGGVGDGGDR